LSILTLVSWAIGVLFSHKEQNYFICRKMGETGDHHFEQNQPSVKKKPNTALICGI
jgi:hypothetical protein